MSKPNPFYNGTQADLASGAQNLIDIVTPSAPAYGLTSAQLTAYTTLTTAYVDLLELAIEPATRTKVVVADKNEAKRNLTRASVDFAKIITATPAVNNGQLIALRLNPRTVPQPQPIPTVAPNATLRSVTGWNAKVRASDAENPTSRAKAPGTVGVNWYAFVGPEAPSDPNLFKFHGMSTKCLAEIGFDSALPSGSTVWVTCAWVGSRGNVGPASLPISFTLQGGVPVPVVAPMKIAA